MIRAQQLDERQRIHERVKLVAYQNNVGANALR